MLRIILVTIFFWVGQLWAQEQPASPSLQTIGLVDSESDQKSSVVTVRYDSKPGFQKPKLAAHGSFIEVLLPDSLVLKPGVFMEAKSPYIRKFAMFQIDEHTAALRLFVSKEASHLIGAIKADILENRVVVVLDHVEAEKQLLANFDGVPVQGGPSPEEIVQKTEVRTDIPDPVKLGAQAKVAEAAEVGKAENVPANGSSEIKDKLIVVTIFIAAMLIVLIALKTWRRLAVSKWPSGPTSDYTVKTLATHALGPKQKLTVIQIGQEQMLLGVTADGINFLTSLKHPGESNKISLDPAYLQRPPMLSREVQLKEPARMQRQVVLDETPIKPVKRSRPLNDTELPEPGSAISYGIGDHGIKNLKKTAQDRSGDGPTSVDDVTRLIRKKLRDLPKV